MHKIIAAVAAIAFLCLAPSAQAQNQSSGISICSSASLSVSGISANLQLSSCGPSAIVWNTGQADAFVTLSAVPGVATTTSQSVPAGCSIIYNTGLSPSYLNAISAAGNSTTLTVSQGFGIVSLGCSSSSPSVNATLNAIMGYVSGSRAGFVATPFYQRLFNIVDQFGITVDSLGNRRVAGMLTDGLQYVGITSAFGFPDSAKPALNVAISPRSNGFAFTNIASQTTTVIKQGPGILHAICINSPAATGTVQAYDNLAGSGTKIALVTSFAAVVGCQTYDAIFNVGLTIVTATASPDITVTWR